MKGEEAAERELMETAVHEAGHLVALRALGGVGHARVWAIEPRREGDVRWCGRTEVFVRPDVAGWEVPVGLAGLVAEFAEECRNDAEAIAVAIRARGPRSEVMASDAAAVQRALDLLLPRWSEVVWEADWMAKACRTVT